MNNLSSPPEASMNSQIGGSRGLIPDVHKRFYVRRSNVYQQIFFWFLPSYFVYIALAGNLYNKRSFAAVVVGGLATLYVTVTVVKFPKGLGKFSPVWLFFLYLFVLIAFSSDKYVSFKNYLEAYIPMMLLYIGYIFVKNFDDLRKLNRAVVVLAGLYLINLLAANSLNLGGAKYLKNNDWQTGNVFTEGLNSMAYALVLVPFFIRESKKKLEKIVLFGGASIIFITMIITLKRISIVATITGYVFFYFMAGKKRQIVKIGMYMGLFFALTYPLYKGILLERIDARADRLKMNSLESEGRYIEAIGIWKNALSFTDPTISLFGREIFNSPGNYGYRFSLRRQIHADYNSLLHGAGFVGLIWYVGLHGYLFLFINKIKKRLKKQKIFEGRNKILYGVFFSFVIMSLLISLSGGITSVLFNGIKYSYLGAISSLLIRVSRNRTRALCLSAENAILP